jgi:hypothetical protein
VVATSPTLIILICVKITTLATTYDHRLRRIGLSLQAIVTSTLARNCFGYLYLRAHILITGSRDPGLASYSLEPGSSGGPKIMVRILVNGVPAAFVGGDSATSAGG